MVKRLPPPLGCGDGYLNIILNLVLPDEVSKAAGSEASVKGYILGSGLT